MPWVSEEQIQMAEKVNLLTYLQTYEPNELVRAGANQFCTKEHDSLKINAYSGEWFWFSRDFGGKNALQYFTKVKALPFPDAVLLLTEGRAISFRSFEPKPEPERPFILPEKNANNDRIYAYLRQRGISSSVINHCIKAGTLYESKDYHSCVFVGRDRNDKDRFACIRAIKGSFRQDVAGSKKQYGFSIPAGTNSHDLLVFESPIDAMSNATIAQIKIPYKPWDSWHRVSLGGVSEKSMLEYLDQHKEINQVVLALDNDDAGQEASQKLASVVQDLGLQCKIRLPQKAKDYNELLQ